MIRWPRYTEQGLDTIRILNKSDNVRPSTLFHAVRCNADLYTRTVTYLMNRISLMPGALNNRSLVVIRKNLMDS
jgi:hypothetical protein